MNQNKKISILLAAAGALLIGIVSIGILKVDGKVSDSLANQAALTATETLSQQLKPKGFSSFFIPFISVFIYPTPTLTLTSTSTIRPSIQTQTPTRTTTRLSSLTPTVTRIFSSTPTFSQLSPTPTLTQIPGTVLETFEGSSNTWQIIPGTNGTGIISQSQDHPFAGNNSARVDTSGSGSSASIAALNFLDRAGDHIWGERPGTWDWQRAFVYLPSQTITSLGSTGYLDLAGFWPSSGGSYGWWLRVRKDKNGNAALSVDGYDLAGNQAEFNVYGQLPTDQWVDFSIGLNSQAGPGVKRAFAFLINGNFFGWYHQGHMDTETYNRAGLGIIHTNSNSPLTVYIDQWYAPQTQSVPGGPDLRSNANLQSEDYRTLSGVQWQIDWSTWENNLVLDSGFGLFSSNSRLQSGHNLDRMPDLSNGWAQIELDWPDGIPPASNGPFSGLVGFHKEINREQNLEVAPMTTNGTTSLLYDAWTGAETDLASWPLPMATTLKDGRNIPEPGDIIRIRWEQINTTQINLLASYYDASTQTWYNNIINDTRDLSSVASKDSSLPGNVNFLDGFHKASSITIDSPFYSIRNYTVGVLSTYPGP